MLTPPAGAGLVRDTASAKKIDTATGLGEGDAGAAALASE